MRNRRLLLLILGPVLAIVGYNNIDAMMWTFYWSEGRWRLWYPHTWSLSPWLFMDTFLAYLFLGIIPLCLGFLIIGYTLGEFKERNRDAS